VLWPWSRAAAAPLASLLPLGLRRALWLLAALSLALLLAGENPGVVVYAGVLLLAFAAARALLPGRRAATLAAWRALPPPLRGALEGLVLPLLAWWLSPSPLHPRTVFDFLRNRPGEPLAWGEHLRFYPRALLRDYAPWPWLGVAALAAAALAPLLWRRGGAGLRAVALAAWIGLALATLHGYKEPRFLATLAPVFFLLAGLGVVGLAADLTRHHAAAAALGALLAIALGATVVASPRLDAVVAARYPLYSGPAALAPALAWLPGALRGARRVALVGAANELSPDLVRWQLHQQAPPRPIEVLEPPRRLSRRDRPAVVRRGVVHWLGEERAERVLAVEVAAAGPLTRSSDFGRHNAWQQELAAALRRTASWREVATRAVPPLGVTFRVYAPRRLRRDGEAAARRGRVRRREAVGGAPPGARRQETGATSPATRPPSRRRDHDRAPRAPRPRPAG
jgi:hypothetical protein